MNMRVLGKAATSIAAAVCFGSSIGAMATGNLLEAIMWVAVGLFNAMMFFGAFK